MLESMRGALFDLDGVIVDTAKYHFLAWKRLANTLGFDFSEIENEQLKGVSRVESLNKILSWGGIELGRADKSRYMELKNAWYLEYVDSMAPDEILDGVVEFFNRLRDRRVQIALGSASKNAARILDRVGLTGYFDAIIDGNSASKSKPDPQVFLLGADSLGLEARHCVVFEDAPAGVAAGKAAGMRVVGVGRPGDLPEADMVVPGIHSLVWDRVPVRI